jgi:hypothetical protein
VTVEEKRRGEEIRSEGDSRGEKERRRDQIRR